MHRRLQMFRAFIYVSLLFMAGPAYADAIRVLDPNTAIRLRGDDTSTVLLTVPPGTVLEAATRDGDYFRVTLPPDQNGFRRVGYVRARAVEVMTASDAPSVTVPPSGSTEGGRSAAPSGPAALGTANAGDRVDPNAMLTVAVLPFGFSTVQRWWGGTWQIGQGVSDLVVDSLVNGSGMQVIERERLAAILAEHDLANTDLAAASAARVAEVGKLAGARYMVVGSITQFSYDQGPTSNVGSAAGGVSVRSATAHVRITARLIETSTGYIVASAVGVSDRTRHSVAARGRSYGSGVALTSNEFRNTALGEATELAVRDCVRQLEAGRLARRAR